MKRIITVIVFALLSLTACTQGTESAASQKEESTKVESDEKKEASIIGTWAYVDGSVVRENVNMIFNKDLTGNNSMVGDFAYTADGKNVVFTYIGNKVYTNPIDFEYRIEDDKLIIVDEVKQETVYQKQ
jgi:lipoprotein